MEMYTKVWLLVMACAVTGFLFGIGWFMSECVSVLGGL